MHQTNQMCFPNMSKQKESKWHRQRIVAGIFVDVLAGRGFQIVLRPILELF